MRDIQRSDIPQKLFDRDWEDRLVQNEVAMSMVRMLEAYISDIRGFIEQDFLFHKIVVSLWLVIPILIIWPLILLALLITFLSALWVVDQISFGSCSTHPFFGKYCLNSYCETNSIFPLVLKRITLEEVVPWSIEIKNFFNGLCYA